MPTAANNDHGQKTSHKQVFVDHPSSSGDCCFKTIDFTDAVRDLYGLCVSNIDRANLRMKYLRFKRVSFPEIKMLSAIIPAVKATCQLSVLQTAHPLD